MRLIISVAWSVCDVYKHVDQCTRELSAAGQLIPEDSDRDPVHGWAIPSPTTGRGYQKYEYKVLITTVQKTTTNSRHSLTNATTETGSKARAFQRPKESRNNSDTLGTEKK